MNRPISKIVLDTNVLISSLWGNKPYQVIQLWEKGEILLLLSQPILDEYFRVLNRFSISEEDLDHLYVLFSNSEKTLFLHPKIKIHQILEDPPDDRFLECAVEGQADFIISGNKHLLNLKIFQGIPIVNPSQFLNLRNDLSV